MSKKPAFFYWIFSALMACGQAVEPIKAELVTLGWEASVGGLWYQAKEGPRELSAYERGFSNPEEYNGPPEIRFFADKAALNLPPEKRPKPVAIATLPPKGGQFLLIVTRKPVAEEGWDVRVIDNSTSLLPAGAFRVMNLTMTAVQVSLDRQVTALTGPGMAILKPAGGEPTRDISIGVAIGSDVVYSSVWGYRDSRRTTVFIVADPAARGGINVRRFYQAVVPDEPPAP